MNIDETKYTKTVEPNGRIIFDPIKEEGRWRAEKQERYYFPNSVAQVQTDCDDGYPVGDRRYNSGNYYKTQKAVQAVSALREHVYSFPIGKGDDKERFLFEDWRTIDDVSLPWYDWYSIHISSTPEDREERKRLIDEVLLQVWYVTI